MKKKEKECLFLAALKYRKELKWQKNGRSK